MIRNKEMIEEISIATGLSREDSAKALAHILAVIVKGVVRDGKVLIPNFCRFFAFKIKRQKKMQGKLMNVPSYNCNEYYIIHGKFPKKIVDMVKQLNDI